MCVWCLHMSTCIRPSVHMKVKRQFMEISSCILPCGSQRLDLGHQTWWPAPLPAEPSHQPARDFTVKKGRAFLTEEEETMEPVTGMESKLILQDPRRGEALSVSGAKGKRDLNASVSHLSKNPETWWRI